MKSLLLLPAALLCALAAVPALAASNPQVSAAIADPARPSEEVRLDALRKPAEVIGFAGLAIYRALKPGGVYLVIDHAAESGSGLRDTETLHRIDPQSIRAEVTAAGFLFAGESPVLRNPHDSHQLRVFDPLIRHRTDQMVLKFRKPS